MAFKSYRKLQEKMENTQKWLQTEVQYNNASEQLQII